LDSETQFAPELLDIKAIQGVSFLVILAVVRSRYRAMTLQWLFKGFLVFLGNCEIVAEPAAEESSALFAADFYKVLVMLADHLHLFIHELGLGSTDGRQPRGGEAG
jgi:hypothetical protein